MESLDVVFQQDPSIVSRNIAGETVLVPIRRSAGDLDSIYALNETAARIWELVDGQRPLRAILDTVIAEFEVAPEMATADLLELVAQLEEVGALRPA
ncbi:MAG: PqqD family protein [Anaerolineae bacterium]|nr:PqqD family protein [Anaerolineae bacterium]